MAITTKSISQKNSSLYWEEFFKVYLFPTYAKFKSVTITPYMPRMASTSTIAGGSNTYPAILSWTVDSVNSPTLHTYKTIRVRPLRYKRPRAPKQPTILQPLKPKVWKPVKPPKLLDDRQSISKQALLRYAEQREAQKIAYGQYLAKLHQLNRIRKSKNVRRKQFYDERLAVYRKRLALFETGVLVKRKVIVKRDRPNNPYSRTITNDRGLRGMITWYKRTSTYTGDYGSPNGPYVSRYGWTLIEGSPVTRQYADMPNPGDSTEAASNSRCIANLKRKRDKQVAHLGNIIAERHKTLAYLQGKLKQLIALKRNPKQFVKQLLGTRKDEKFSKNVSDEFLAFQFGVKPLVSEVYSAFTHLKNQPLTRDKLVIRSSVTSTESTSAPATLRAGLQIKMGGAYNAAVEAVDVISNQVNIDTITTVSYVLEYSIENGALDLLQNFGLANPAEIAWEVLPWSFVVDWFLPIGDWIRSFNNSRLVFVGGVKTVKRKRVYNTKLVLDSKVELNGGGGFHCDGEVFGSYETDTKTRTVLSVEPFAIYPELKNPFSMYHILEALALLRQRTK